jgi:hypothetical protein
MSLSKFTEAFYGTGEPALAPPGSGGAFFPLEPNSHRWGPLAMVTAPYLQALLPPSMFESGIPGSLINPLATGTVLAPNVVRSQHLGLKRR